jgi:protein-disulfide isomerase
MSRFGSLVLMVGLLAGVLWAGRQGAPGSVDAGWAAAHDQELRRVLNLPPSAELEFREVQEKADAARVLAVLDAVDGNVRERLQLTVSRDGEQLLYEGRTYRLADPFAAIRERIALGNPPALGPADAPVTIVEYSDYTCVYCRRFSLTQEKEILDRYHGQVRLVYKHFPLVHVRPAAEDAAVAAACAYRQGNQQFWAYHQALFQQAERLEEGRGLFLELAREAGLNAAPFRRCLDERQGLFEVARDVEEAESLGVQVTPTFFVNGRSVYGVIRPEYFFYIVEQELAVARGG